MAAHGNPGSRAARALVVFLCETRAWELTATSFREHVLEPLDADLALCVANNSREVPNPYYEWARFTWQIDEPADWADLLTAESGGRDDWRRLEGLDESFLGGTGTGAERTPGSGAIIMFFRRLLRQELAGRGLADEYDWFIITRSDFLWLVPHVPLDLLDQSSIYIFDGEHYGGVTDRYAAIPADLIHDFLTIPDPIFDSPDDLCMRLRAVMAASGGLMNPEIFIATRLREIGLWDRVRWLPYCAFSVRTAQGHTSWSGGTFDQAHGFFVKYPEELARSRALARAVRTEDDWRVLFAPVRGLAKRQVLALRLWYALRMPKPWRRLLSAARREA